MVEQIINWTKEIIEDNTNLIGLAAKRRSKFEGWFKFELARKLYINGVTEIDIEKSNDEISRCDLSFLFNEEQYYVELKTPNTNWRINGIENLNRPITLNRADIIRDVDKFRESQITNGIICFILFPIPPDDNRWNEFVNTIAHNIGQEISHEQNCKIQRITFNNIVFDILICCFRVI